MTNISQTDERRNCTSASNALYDKLCPGRHFASRDLPDIKSEDAAHGDVIHAALSEDAREGVNVGALSSLTFQQREIYDTIREIEKKVLTQFFGGEPADGRTGDKTFKEQRFWCKVPPEKYEHSAKPDKVHRRGHRALIIEYKTLTGDVPEAASNPQLRDQAILVRGNLLVEEIGVVVIQPLVTHNPEICVYQSEDLKRAEQEMFARVRESNRVGAVKVPGPIQCKFCKAAQQGVCQEYQIYATNQLPVNRSLVELPLSQWTGKDFAAFLDKKAIAQKWLDDAETAAKKFAELNPEGIPGWSLQPGNEVETITDIQGVYSRFIALGGKQEAFMNLLAGAKIKGKLKEALSEATKLKGKQLAQELEKLLQGCTEKKQNQPSIARS